MKFSTVTMLLSLVPAIAAASGIENFHKRHQHKRDASPETNTVFQTQVDVQTVDQVVTVTDDGEGNYQTPAPTTTVAPASVAPVSVVNADVVASAPASSSAAASASSSAAASASAPASASASGSASASSSSSSSTSSPDTFTVDGSGSLGITYSPYSNSGACKSASDVASDIKKLSAYNIIRLYAVDCSGVKNVVSALGSGQKLFAGLYSLNTIAADVGTLHSDIQSAGKDWSVVYAVSVGNELVNSGSASVSQIQSGISTAKSSLTSAGYTGPVVSVDTFKAVLDNTQLCQYSDFVAVNAHPFFDGGIAAADAGTWVKKIMGELSSACGSDKKVIITESGWPHSGDSNGDAVPSVSNQEAAIKSIKSEVGDNVFLFTVYNDYWKAPGSFNVEQSWGIYGDS